MRKKSNFKTNNNKKSYSKNRKNNNNKNKDFEVEVLGLTLFFIKKQTCFCFFGRQNFFLSLSIYLCILKVTHLRKIVFSSFSLVYIIFKILKLTRIIIKIIKIEIPLCYIWKFIFILEKCI